MSMPVASPSFPFAPARRRTARRVAGTVLLGALALLAAQAAAPAQAAAACHPDARALRVTFQPIDHSLAPASRFRSRVTLRNGDSGCALEGDWKLYFNFVREPLAVYPPGPLGDAARQQLADQGFGAQARRRRRERRLLRARADG